MLQQLFTELLMTYWKQQLKGGIISTLLVHFCHFLSFLKPLSICGAFAEHNTLLHSQTVTQKIDKNKSIKFPHSC